jgi:hypothetical protein
LDISVTRFPDSPVLSARDDIKMAVIRVTVLDQKTIMK